MTDVSPPHRLQPELLRIEGLRTTFRTPMGPIAAVDGVSLSVAAGKTLGIVGESGCGKVRRIRPFSDR